jgi:hypothetical protein
MRFIRSLSDCVPDAALIAVLLRVSRGGGRNGSKDIEVSGLESGREEEAMITGVRCFAPAVSCLETQATTHYAVEKIGRKTVMAKTTGVFDFEIGVAGVSIVPCRNYITNAAMSEAELKTLVAMAKADLDAVAVTALSALKKVQSRPLFSSTR